MKLSIVIVNYNVASLLEQCLLSVRAAVERLRDQTEVWVVDNASVDGSVEMLRQRFEWVRLIASERNLGFSAGNNLAISQCSGEYILLLNPDTLLPENALERSLAEMDSDPKIGGLGIRMVDGQGRYWPESKRGLPELGTALFKIIGLSSLFPTSRVFARYYLGHLSPERDADVEILSGAYFMLRKSALDEIGSLDERFFMYGEDIDLSYRLLKAGYRNRYLSEPQIVHYKGESTKKSSLRYVYVFYQAMALFVEKHPEIGGGPLYSGFIRAAIWLRAALSWSKRIVGRLSLPLFDFWALYVGMWGLTTYWERNHRFVSGGGYPPEFLGIAVPVYIAVWMMGSALYGAYDKPAPKDSVWKGIGWSGLVLLAAYALVDEEWRFSRALLVLGAGWALLAMSSIRRIAGRFEQSNRVKRTALVSRDSASLRVFKSRFQASEPLSNAAFELDLESGTEPAALRLFEACRVLHLDEIALDGAALGGSRVLEMLRLLSGASAELTIAQTESDSGPGLRSVDGMGRSGRAANRIESAAGRREKRVFELLSSLMVLASGPFLAWFKSGRVLLSNAPWVLLGARHWVGLDGNKIAESSRRTAVFHPIESHRDENISPELKEQFELYYRSEYSYQMDAKVLWKVLTASEEAKNRRLS